MGQGQSQWQKGYVALGMRSTFDLLFDPLQLLQAVNHARSVVLPIVQIADPGLLIFPFCLPFLCFVGMTVGMAVGTAVGIAVGLLTAAGFLKG